MGLQRRRITVTERLAQFRTREAKEDILDCFADELENLFGMSIFVLADMVFGRIPDTSEAFVFCLSELSDDEELPWSQ